MKKIILILCLAVAGITNANAQTVIVKRPARRVVVTPVRTVVVRPVRRVVVVHH